MEPRCETSHAARLVEGEAELGKPRAHRWCDVGDETDFFHAGKNAGHVAIGGDQRVPRLEAGTGLAKERSHGRKGRRIWPNVAVAPSFSGQTVAPRAQVSRTAMREVRSTYGDWAWR